MRKGILTKDLITYYYGLINILITDKWAGEGMKTPELWELISVFECEPKYIYGENRRIPWFYNTLEFVY